MRTHFFFPKTELPPQKKGSKALNDSSPVSGPTYEETWWVGGTVSTGYALHVLQHWPQLTATSQWSHPVPQKVHFWVSRHWCCWQWLCLKQDESKIFQQKIFSTEMATKSQLPVAEKRMSWTTLRNMVLPSSRLHNVGHHRHWGYSKNGLEIGRFVQTFWKHVQFSRSSLYSLLQLSQLNTKCLRCCLMLFRYQISLISICFIAESWLPWTGGMIQPGPAERPPMGSPKSSSHEGLPGVRWCWRRSTTWKGNHLLVQLEIEKWGKCCAFLNFKYRWLYLG